MSASPFPNFLKSNSDMPTPIYPIFIIVAVIIYYIFNKKEPAPLQEEEPEPKRILCPFLKETKEQFILRCYNFARDFFAEREICYHHSSDLSSFVSSFEDKDNAMYNVSVEVFFSNGDKVIMFHTKIIDVAIPDDKLWEVGELINRLNEKLLVNTLNLSYEHRSIDSTVFYMVGDHPLIEDYFEFYYKTIVRSRNMKTAFIRIIQDHENPALVALEW